MLSSREIGYFVAIARDVVRLIDATTIAITDISSTRLTRNQIAALINRYHAEHKDGSPPNIADT